MEFWYEDPETGEVRQISARWWAAIVLGAVPMMAVSMLLAAIFWTVLFVWALVEVGAIIVGAVRAGGRWWWERLWRFWPAAMLLVAVAPAAGYGA